MRDTKYCSTCEESLPLTDFPRDSSQSDGFKYRCRGCENEATRQRRARRTEERIASDHEALRPEDFDVSVGNVGAFDKEATAQKRQEYSRRMGEFHSALRTSEMTPELGDYIGRLAEQERRFGNRRIARSVSIAAAHEALHIAQVKDFCEKYLTNKIHPAGYAKAKNLKPTRRAITLFLSDLHFGAELSEIDNPVPFRAKQEARRFEWVIRQALEYKVAYREHTELILLLNGDLIEGYLQHDLRDGAPLAEQKVIFWKYLSAALGLLAAEFPKVRVVARPGNHGRDKLRHPGRATSSKWDGHEWSMYYGLMMMSAGLPNVTWDLDRKPLAVVDVFGQKLGVTHGDTEIKLGNPLTKAQENSRILDRINSSKVYGVEIDAWAFGHFHTGALIPGRPGIVWNGGLLPPNGHARTAGYFGNACGQWIWESVPGHLLGDARFIRVGEEQDSDESLGALIPPFRLD